MAIQCLRRDVNGVGDDIDLRRKNKKLGNKIVDFIVMLVGHLLGCAEVCKRESAGGICQGVGLKSYGCMWG